MSATWILVADAARARIFNPQPPKPRKKIDFAGRAGRIVPVKPQPDELAEIAALVHPESELKGREIVSDGPGSFQERAGGRHSGQPQTDLKHQAAQNFAMQVIARLEKARQEGQFDRLVLIAAPLFLGTLREKLTSPLRQMIALEIDKDYTKLRPDEIRSRLPEQL